MKTSISDESKYTVACKLFVEDDKSFETFKRHPHYTEILEHSSKAQALDCIKYISGSALDLSKLYLLEANDEQGSPNLAHYDNPAFDNISPSTIRYIKVLAEIVDTFGNLDSGDIVEIGVGYGGQCKVINDYFNVGSYQLVDLDVVEQLSEKYLSKYGYKNLCFGKPYKDEYDLVISNYAITECDRAVQIDYIDNVLNKSKHGYITYNRISDIFNVDSLSYDELIDRIDKDVTVHPEYPNTNKDNCLLIW